jgi:hypothetical protein
MSQEWNDFRMHQECKEFKMNQELREKERIAAHARNLRVLAEIKELCGPPPVLSSESVEAYYKVMFRLIEAFMPRDFMEQMFLKHLTDYTWEIIRYTRQRTLNMERKFQQLLKSRSQGREIDQSPTEYDHAEAHEHGIGYDERLDKLLNSAILRRDDVLQQWERYRDGLGRYLQAVSDDIINDNLGNPRPGLLPFEAFIPPQTAERLGFAQDVEDPLPPSDSEAQQAEPPTPSSGT